MVSQAPSRPLTLARLLLDALARGADRDLFYEKRQGRWVATKGRQALEMARALALGLHARGVRKGDRVAIIGGCRPEWSALDMANLCLGAVTVGLYTSSTPAQAAYILGHAGARVAVHEDAEQGAKVAFARSPEGAAAAAKDGAPAPAIDHALSFADLTGLAAEGDAQAARDPGLFDRLLAGVEPGDLATIIYTSGTTGPPKGAMLTHANIVSVIEATRDMLPLGPEDLGVAFLPLAHALQRVAGYAGIVLGVRGAFAESIERLPENWREVRPTVQASVPRIWEKAYARVQHTLAAAPPRRRRIFTWALDVGRRMAEHRRRGTERFAPLTLRLQHALADRLVFRRFREVFGGRVRFLTSGGAPISRELLEFFYAVGVFILEGWGLTETAAPATFNTPAAWKFGTVGRAIRGTEIRIAEDGEVLVKGPGVFSGYWQDPSATREAFTSDGYFKTGDIGALDAEGFLSITDRKKSLIVTSSGKKIPPANVENAIKARSALVSQVYVHGDRRSYLVALVTLDPEESARVTDPDAEVARAIEAANRELATHEQVKRWRALPRELTQEDGLLTPTLKQKRKAIEARFASEIEALYAEEAGTRNP